MRSALHVVAAFALVITWSTSSLAQDARVAAGQKLFAAQKCSICHAVLGKGNVKHPLDGVGKTITPEMVKLWLTDPKAAEAKAGKKATPPMKSFASLPAEDIDALVAYVMSLK
jgi:mono/diheme cytochrome c family protein